MAWADNPSLTFHGDVLPEPAKPDGRLILWLAAKPNGVNECWERVGNIPHVAITTERGLCFTAATAAEARQVRSSPLRQLLQRFQRSATSTRVWSLPDGTTVEQCSPRRADLRFVWAEDETQPLDETRVRELWPQCEKIRALGPNLFLVYGVRPDPPTFHNGTPSDAPAAESPVQQAERVLNHARSSSDAHRLVTALADLGLAHLKDGNFPRARDVLEEAVAAARRLGDPAREVDAACALGQTLIALGQPSQARQVLCPARTLARSTGDRYAEKAVMEHLGHVQVALSDHAGALATFEQALGIAVELRDLQHVADLLWLAAIQHAELGNRDRALAAGRQAVEVLRRMAKPQADWYAQHIDAYQSAAPGTALPAPPNAFQSSSVDATAFAPRPYQSPAQPGLLRMARTATEAMLRFVGSGFKTTPEPAYRARLQVCTTCPHHTGLRCRVCGCFTTVKAKLLHEACPAGHWPH